MSLEILFKIKHELGSTFQNMDFKLPLKIWTWSYLSKYGLIPNLQFFKSGLITNLQFQVHPYN